MRTLLFVLLLPLMAFAQISETPDSVYMKNGKASACMLTHADKEVLQVIYLKNPLKIPLSGIQRASVGQKGIVFLAEKGYIMDMDAINGFLAEREQKRLQEKADAEAAARRLEEERKEAAKGLKAESVLPTAAAGTIGATQAVDDIQAQSPACSHLSNGRNRWSLGITYVPYFVNTI